MLPALPMLASNVQYIQLGETVMPQSIADMHKSKMEFARHQSIDSDEDVPSVGNSMIKDNKDTEVISILNTLLTS